MQQNKQASILIWSIFLTLLMSFSFIFIQGKIKSSLSTNSKKLENIKLEKQKEDFLGEINAKTTTLGENNLEIKNFSNIEYSLKKDEMLNLNFIETGSINLELLNSGIISYTIDGTNNFGKNILPTYNTGTTSTGGIEVFSGTKLKIKNFSGYSKIKIGASKKLEYKLDSLPKTIIFKKAGKITLSIGRKGGEIKYKINSGDYEYLTGDSNIAYVNKSFFINSGDKLLLEKISYQNRKKVIISGDYNLSDLLQNNSYKIFKTTWGKEIILEKGKIK